MLASRIPHKSFNETRMGFPEPFFSSSFLPFPKPKTFNFSEHYTELLLSLVALIPLSIWKKYASTVRAPGLRKRHEFHFLPRWGHSLSFLAPPSQRDLPCRAWKTSFAKYIYENSSQSSWNATYSSNFSTKNYSTGVLLRSWNPFLV